MFDFIKKESMSLESELIALRRELHKVPEIGGTLPKTKEIVCAKLTEYGIAYTLCKSDDGIIADICGNAEGKTIAFRADMDALHIDENTGLEYSSEIPGQMHGCGHDAHTAILLVASKIINENKDKFSGRVRLIFQTGEETGTGALNMLSEGVLDGVDAICAIHVGNLAGDDHATGTVVVLPGAVSAGKNKFTVTIHGKGTHTAFPEKGVDPILIAARIVNATEELQSREVPAGTASVLSFGSIHAGLDHNTIPDTAELKGSIRCQNEDIREFLGNRLKDIAGGIATAFRASVDVEIKRGSRTVMNDENLSRIVADACMDTLGQDMVKTKISSALMGSDDFANYASRIPGVYFFLCTNNPDKGICEANHNPAFDIDESVLWEGVAAYTAVALRYLSR